MNGETWMTNSEGMPHFGARLPWLLPVPPVRPCNDCGRTFYCEARVRAPKCSTCIQREVLAGAS